MGYSVKKVGVDFKLKLGTGADNPGHAATFNAYYENDITGDKVDIEGDFTESSYTEGLYFSPAFNVPAKGDYTVVVNNPDIGMDNHEGPVIITDSSIDDIKLIVDEINSKVDLIVEEVAGLDGASLQVVIDEVLKVKTLISDSTDVGFNVSGDESALIVVGKELTGTTSGATGIITKSVYNSDNDITKVVLSGVSGTFQDDETITVEGTESAGTINTVEINVVNSVLEFVEKIKEATDAGAGDSSVLDVLKGYTDDIENVLTGSEYLADGTTENPFFGKTNVEIFDKLAETFTNTEEIEVLATSIKTTVEANATALADLGTDVDGLLEQLNTRADTLDTSFVTVLDLLNHADYGLSAIKDLIVTRFDTVDTTLVDVNSKLDGLEASNNKQFNLFA